MTTTEMLPSKQRRRHFVLSLRFLMLLVLVVGGGLGWIIRSVRIQRRAVEAISRSGGVIYYDYEHLNKSTDRHIMHNATFVGGQSRVPRRLRQWLGDDYFHSVEGVCYFSKPDLTSLNGLPRLRTLIIGTVIDDDVLIRIGTLNGLQNLHLILESPLTDENLRHLASLTNLQTLSIHGYGDLFTQAGLARLRGLSRLRRLSFRFIKSEKATPGLEVLREFKELRDLELSCENIANIDFYQISELKQLQSLTIDTTSIDPKLFNKSIKSVELPHLAGLTRLRKLDLSTSRFEIKDADLKFLSELVEIEEIRLPGRFLTDMGLAHLQNLKALRVLDLGEIGIDRAVPAVGIANLKTALPLLRIEFEAGPGPLELPKPEPSLFDDRRILPSSGSSMKAARP